jgi:hypothetical protein
MPGDSLGYPDVPIGRKLLGLIKAPKTNIHLVRVVLILVKEG